MSKAHIQKSVFHAFKTIKRALKDFKKNTTPEALHELRVQVKFLRAVAAFLNFTEKEEIDFSTLKPMFKQAGAIRELQLNIEIVEKSQTFSPGRLKILRNKLEDLQKKFGDSIAGFTMTIKAIRKDVVLPDEVPDHNKIKAYFRNRLNEILWMERIADRSEMHRFRKIIKELLAVRAILPGKIQSMPAFDQEFLQKVQRKAGEWHDTFMAIEFLSAQAKTLAMKKYLFLLKHEEEKRFEGLLKYRNKINKLLLR